MGFLAGRHRRAVVPFYFSTVDIVITGYSRLRGTYKYYNIFRHAGGKTHHHNNITISFFFSLEISLRFKRNNISAKTKVRYFNARRSRSRTIPTLTPRSGGNDLGRN